MSSFPDNSPGASTGDSSPETSTSGSSSDDPWISQHVFHHDFDDVERVDALIAHGVRPVVRSLTEEGLVDRYFFIRYRERGPHVRLRLRAASPDDTSEVEARSREQLTQYLDRHPSPPVDWIDDVYDDPCPNNSVQTIPYEPEVQRYAGERGVEIAERHFQASSDAVFHVLDQMLSRSGESGSGNLRLMYALQLIAVLVLSGGFDRSSAADFVADHLEHVIIPDFDDTAVDEAFDALRDSLLPRFNQLLKLYHGDLQGDAFTERWIASTQDTTDALADHIRDPSTPYDAMNPAIGVHDKYGLVLQSYIHMTLNRLGIWGEFEKFVLELLHRIFRTLEPSSASAPQASTAG